MASRRMFSTLVTDSDAFSDMPLSAQALYFHLGMETDDYGVVSAPRRVCRSIGASEDDYRLLVAKGFLLVFDSGIAVVVHHFVNNSFKGTHKKKTLYEKELGFLEKADDGTYRFISPGQSPSTQIAPKLHPNSTDSVMLCSVTDTVTGKESTSNVSQVDTTPYGEVIAYLNAKTGASFRATTESTRRLIRARSKEGYTLDDFKRVIDNKCAAWKHDPKMFAYLRPATLFAASKFEGYLNESQKEVPDDYAKYR